MMHYAHLSLAALKRYLTHDGKEITDVHVSASLKSVTIEFASICGPLFNFTAMGTLTQHI